MDEHRIAKLWERGMAAEQSEDWTKAKRLYRKVADAVPRHAPTFQRLGLIALRESRRMLDYCELDWQSVCLEFHRNKRPVRTASSWQVVRQPLYRTAKARWRKFELHLDGLKKALSDRAVRWDSAG